jgi:hypothetical protein
MILEEYHMQILLNTIIITVPYRLYEGEAFGQIESES